MKFIIANKSYEIEAFRTFQTDEKWIIEIQQFLEDWFSFSDYLEVQTSGSTGTPKKILLPKYSFRVSAQITNTFFNLNALSIALLCLPIKYIAGKLMVIRSLEANMDLILEEPGSTPLFSTSKEIGFVAMTPFQVDGILKEASNRFDQIGTLIIGGGVLSHEIENKLQKVATQCFQSYGMTETLTHIALKRINGPDPQDRFEVLPGFNISLDERGCLVIEAEHILNGRIVTNDLVELHDRGSFEWLGRVDNVINSGGIKIYPEKVESKLSGLIQSPYFIGGKEDKSLGEKVVLCIESKIWGNEDRATLQNEMKILLNKYEVPRSILFFDCFLYTPNGKIQRQKTLALDASE